MFIHTIFNLLFTTVSEPCTAAASAASVRSAKTDVFCEIAGKFDEKRTGNPDFKALIPYTDLIREGLGDLVDGEHFFDTIDEKALFEFRYEFPGWPREIRGRADLMDAYSGYGVNIKLHKADYLVVHRCRGNKVVILEYEVHGKILATGVPYNNRFVSIVSVDQRKIVRWRDYMDSLAAMTALSKG